MEVKTVGNRRKDAAQPAEAILTDSGFDGVVTILPVEFGPLPKLECIVQIGFVVSLRHLEVLFQHPAVVIAKRSLFILRPHAVLGKLFPVDLGGRWGGP